jgi:hypothetical protein
MANLTTSLAFPQVPFTVTKLVTKVVRVPVHLTVGLGFGWSRFWNRDLTLDFSLARLSISGHNNGVSNRDLDIHGDIHDGSHLVSLFSRSLSPCLHFLNASSIVPSEHTPPSTLQPSRQPCTNLLRTRARATRPALTPSRATARLQATPRPRATKARVRPRATRLTKPRPRATRTRRRLRTRRLLRTRKLRTLPSTPSLPRPLTGQREPLGLGGVGFERSRDIIGSFLLSSLTKKHRFV